MACGKIAGSDSRSAVSDYDAAFETSTPKSEASDAALDTSAPDANTDSAFEYLGQLWAMFRSFKGTSSNSLHVAFSQGVEWPPRAASCGTDGVTRGDCCAGFMRTVLPILPTVPLLAGNVTVTRDGSSIATLAAPDYPEIDDAMWSPGDVLGVSAPGGNIAAFSGSFETPNMISGVTPAFGSAPVAIPAGADFRITWAAEGKDGEQMLLQIDLVGTGSSPDLILCAVPDAAGGVVVDAGLISKTASTASGSIHLTRSLVSHVVGANVTVALVGEAWLDALATVE
jgi:hypothetical protein